MPKLFICVPPRTHRLPVGNLAQASLVVAAVLSLAVLPALAQTSSSSSPARSLSVEGSAEMHIAPDTALVTTGVTTEGDTAAAALAANSAALAKVIAAIRGFGVESKDLQTSTLSLAPRYYRPEKPTASDRPRIIGALGKGETLVSPAHYASDHYLYAPSQLAQPEGCLIGAVAMRPGTVDDEQRVSGPCSQ